MAPAAAVVRELPAGSMWAVDERGTALRLTWRLDHGFVNLSIWRDDTCVETFHLSPADAARVASFVVTGLAEVAAPKPAGVVAPLRAEPLQADALRRLRTGSHRWRTRLAGGLRSAADGVEPRSTD